MPRGDLKDTDLLKTARERWKLADESDSKQTAREIEDLGFYAGDEVQQWGATALSMRRGQQPTDGMPAAPDRPTLVVNKVLEPVRQVQNEIRASDIGIELVPADDFGDLGITLDDTEITLREGLIRRIQRESEAEAARNWAGDRATIAGRGFYLVTTRYLPGKSPYQEICVERIYNQAGVKLDPSHTQPDGSDADWGFIGTWVPWDRFKSEYLNLADGTDSPLANASDSDFTSMKESYPDWYHSDDNTKSKAVRVVDYWYAERTQRELLTLNDGQKLTAVWSDEIESTGKGKDRAFVVPEGTTVVETRSVMDKTIKFCKIGGGMLELEQTDVPGPYIPIVKVLGEELQPYDDQRRAIGMVRPARSAQMGFNYMISKLVETVGLSPIPPLIIDPESIDGFEKWYELAATRALYMLPARSYDDQGRPLKEPHRPQADPNLQPMATALGMFDQLIKSTTAVPDPTLGNVDPSLKSGKAIREVVANAKQSTSNFLDNRVRSTRFEGRIINSWLAPVYGQPGRIVQILTGEGSRDKYQIGDPDAQQEQAALQAQAVKVGRLTENANFNIIVKVTKEWESRRQQEAAALGEMISMNPELLTWFGDLYFINSDLPGRKELAERAKAMLAPPIQQAQAEKQAGGMKIPPQVQQQMQQMQEQLKMAEAAIAELSQKAEGKILDAQTKVEVQRMTSERDLALEQMKIQADLEKAKMDNATKLRVAEIAAETKGIVDANRLEHEAIALAHATQHTESEAERDRQQERVIAATSMAHDAAKSDSDADRAEAEAERNRQASTETV